jgi:hypothetical protein
MVLERDGRRRRRCRGPQQLGQLICGHKAPGLEQQRRQDHPLLPPRNRDPNAVHAYHQRPEQTEDCAGRRRDPPPRQANAP